jgi:pimeloyl-ACP methyl ester carboxylesterase
LETFSLGAQARPTCEDLFSHRIEATRQSGRAVQARRLILEGGRSLSLDYLPAEPGQPTLMLMPGAISPVSAEHPAFQALGKTGLGIVSFALSHQPRSLKDAEAAGLRAVERDQISIESLVAETESVRRHFRQAGVDLIPVSLSFTGAITPRLVNAPRIIEMVPMTSADSTSVTGSAFRQQLMAAAAWNPFFGQQIARQQLAMSYRSYWQSVVDGMIRHQSYPADRREAMLDAYVKQSQAIEGFQWKASDLSRSTQRSFILAGQESRSLLKHQLQTLLEMIEAGHQPSVILVKGVEHNIPSSQPELYARLLSWVATHPHLDGLYIFDGATGGIQQIARASMQTQLRAWESALESSDRPADLP